VHELIYEPAEKAATIKNRHSHGARLSYYTPRGGAGGGRGGKAAIFLLFSPIRQFRCGGIAREAACDASDLSISRNYHRRPVRASNDDDDDDERARRGTRKTVGRKRHGGTMPAYDNYTSTTPPVYGRDSNHSRSRRSGLPRGAARLGSARFGSAPP